MRRELAFLPDVRIDFDEVWNHYEEASPGRGGNRFGASYREVLEQIKAGVVTHRVVFGSFHRAFVSQYPYTLYYRIVSESRAVVVALLFSRFDPERIRTVLTTRK